MSNQGSVCVRIAAGVMLLASGLSAETPNAPLRVTHILGFAGAAKNAHGDLSFHDASLHFKKTDGSSCQVAARAIQAVSLGTEDKQVGGTPLALGKAAAPFGGGRVISLFAHKKYDTVTFEYRDVSGGLHGAIFQANKGSGGNLKDGLQAESARGGPPAPEPPSAPEQINPKEWSVQIEKVDLAEVDLEPAFRVAIYENLLEEFAKTKQFTHVFRSGDGRSGDRNVLILKTTVQKYSPGSETKRAVTTVAGATKLKVLSQLSTRDGRVLAERTIDGNVRFFGGNLRATHNLAKNVAHAIRDTKLTPPDAAAGGK